MLVYFFALKSEGFIKQMFQLSEVHKNAKDLVILLTRTQILESTCVNDQSYMDGQASDYIYVFLHGQV